VGLWSYSLLLFGCANLKGKQLAQELNYAGDSNDSASMNVWQHKQVLIKIAENRGKVPQELLS
jgi:hypothetical protein